MNEFRRLLDEGYAAIGWKLDRLEVLSNLGPPIREDQCLLRGNTYSVNGREKYFNAVLEKVALEDPVALAADILRKTTSEET